MTQAELNEIWRKRENLRDELVASARCWRESRKRKDSTAARHHLSNLAQYVDAFDETVEAWGAGYREMLGDHQAEQLALDVLVNEGGPVVSA